MPTLIAPPLSECRHRNLLERLANQYNIDFFVKKPFENLLPSSWQDIMMKMTSTEIRSLLFSKVSPLSRDDGALVLPLGLLCYHTLSHSLTPSRTPVARPEDIADVLGIDTSDGELPPTFLNYCNDSELGRRIKQKKQYEIDRIVALVDIMRRKCPFSNVVDIGAGLGHLSRILSIAFPDMNVHTIEGNDELVRGAAALDSRFERLASQFEAPQRKAEFVQLDRDTRLPDSGSGVCLVGVHACGDLSSSIVTMFAENKNAKALILFGCCFHKLNGGCDKRHRQKWDGVEEREQPKIPGYPLCSSDDSSPSPTLPYFTRELACHAMEQFRIEKDDSTILSQLRRALLEWCVLKVTSPLLQRHLPVKGVKNAHELPFSDYSQKALIDYPEIAEKVAQMLSQSSADIPSVLSRAVIPFISIVSLRLLIAPLAESAVLDDRLRYLRNRGIEAYSLPMFDPLISPRNYAIVAFKS